MDWNFNVNYHSSVCISGEIYIDPFHMEGSPHNAAAVFITHSHYDHYDVNDIRKVINADTVIAAPDTMAGQLAKDGFTKVVLVSQNGDYRINGAIKVKTFPAYNIDKSFHPKNKGWVGYIIEVDGVTYAVCGDTDATEELEKIKCDVLFIPIGGTYTMTAKEAAVCTNKIRPKIAVPIHYNGIVGSKDDESIFIKNINKDILCRTFL